MYQNEEESRKRMEKVFKERNISLICKDCRTVSTEQEAGVQSPIGCWISVCPNCKSKNMEVIPPGVKI